MRYATIAMTVLLVLTTGCSQAPSGETKTADAKAADAAAQSAKDVTDIRAMEDRFIKAFAGKDINGIMASYVPDASLLVFDVVPPRQYVGAPAYRKDFEDVLALFPGPIDVTITDLDVTAGGGDVAFGHSIQHVAGATKDGKKVDLTLRVTDGYKRVAGQWLIAHEHVSVPTDIFTGKSDLTSKP